jgi:hypothetical protein
LAVVGPGASDLFHRLVRMIIRFRAMRLLPGHGRGEH